MCVRCVLYSLFLIIFLNEAAIAAGCGSRGGPGFRGPKGNCVGWKQLSKVCGTPPTSNCTFEGAGEGDTDFEKGTDFVNAGAGGSALTAVGADAARTTKAFNQRVVKDDGIACASTSLLSTLNNCATETDDENCTAQIEVAVRNGQCTKIIKGAETTIEAGSGSFEWVRIKLLGVKGEYWINRDLVLE
ncbi:MAG: hypothetical protein CTY31_12340 [Hyphomicrobium sp.]|nr:MAG: hypothetical protein CTY39_06270 [Hyphomicrobium sp.]PPC98801.1 MAG: hypothetical protein CTY31_12340 [Hyphomicrobium sp.]